MAPELSTKQVYLLTLFAVVYTCRGERVHFRIHSNDLLDQHTHTRTILLHPESETFRHFRQLQLQQQPTQPFFYYQHGVSHPVRASPQQAVSFMRQTLQLQPQLQQVPAVQRPLLRPGLSPAGTAPSASVPGLGTSQASHARQIPVVPIIPLSPVSSGMTGDRQATVMLPTFGFPRLASSEAPEGLGGFAQPRFVSKKTQTSLVTHQMSGPGPWPMHLLLPQGPKGELVPMRLVAVAHSRPVRLGGKMSAALMSPPSIVDLKKGTRCKGFVKSGEEPESGDCFLEEYENGYSEGHSKKIFYGDNTSNSKHEKGANRNTKRFKNESKFTQKPKKASMLATTPPLKSAKKSAPAVHEAHVPAARARARAPSGTTGDALHTHGQPDSEAEDAKDAADSQDEEDDDKALQQEEEVEQADQSLDPQAREEDNEGLVEVFKGTARNRIARLTAPLVAVSPPKAMWVHEFHPVRLKQMDLDEDVYEMEESAPMKVVTSPEETMAGDSGNVAETGLSVQPRALEDMSLSWGSGFSDSLFDSEEPAEKENMEAEANAADFDHSIDGDDDDDDKGSTAVVQGSDDDDDDFDDGDRKEQDNAASELANVLEDAMLGSQAQAKVGTRGPAEQMLQRIPSSTNHYEDSQHLGAILASEGHPHSKGQAEQMLQRTSSSADRNNEDSQHLGAILAPEGHPHSKGQAEQMLQRTSSSADRNNEDSQHLGAILAPEGHPHSKGQAEQMLQRTPSSTDRNNEDSQHLGAILASGGHMFDPSKPPPPHPAAFGARDPDRLESDRKAPVVVEFGHELSGYKVTQERERTEW